MSRAVNIFALFAVLSMATCVSLAPQSQPEQAVQQPMASKVGCGAVNFVVTSYLPRPHANAFCSAYLQESTQAFGSTALPASSTHRDGHSLVPESTHKAFRQATVPEFNWLREREVQQPPQETLLGKACGCLRTAEASIPTQTAAETAPAASSKISIVVQTAAAASPMIGNGTSSHSLPDVRNSELELSDIEQIIDFHGRGRLGLLKALTSLGGSFLS